MPRTEDPIVDAMMQLTQAAADVFTAEARARSATEKVEDARRKKILDVLYKIQNDIPLKTLFVQEDVHLLFGDTSLGKRTDATAIYGISLMETADMLDKIVRTDRGVEWLRRKGDSEERTYETYNICSLADPKNPEDLALANDFFHSALGRIVPEEFEQAVLKSLTDATNSLEQKAREIYPGPVITG